MIRLWYSASASAQHRDEVPSALDEHMEDHYEEDPKKSEMPDPLR